MHNHLVQSIYQPISLGVVGHGPQSLNAKDLTQFPNNAAGKASTSVTQEPGQAPKIEIKPPYRNLAMVFAV